MSDEATAAAPANSSTGLSVMEAAAKLDELAAAPAAKSAEQDETDDQAPPKTPETDTSGAGDEDDDSDAGQDSADRKAPDPEDEVVFEDEDGPVTRKEARASRLRQKDYTQKTQTVAEQRKAVEAEQADIRQKRALYLERLEAVDELLKTSLPEEPNWTKLRDEDPDNFPRIFAEWQVLKDKKAAFEKERDAVRAEEARDRKAQMEAFLDREAEALTKALPDLADKEKGPKLHAELVKTGEAYGFKAEDVTRTVDHRLFLILHDAMQYRALKAEQKKLAEKTAADKQTEKLTPALTPGAARSTAAPTVDKELNASIAKVRQTGQLGDAAAAIAALDRVNRKNKK